MLGAGCWLLAVCCPTPRRTAPCTAPQVRLYRVRWFFRYLEYDLTLSLLWVTLARNLLVSPILCAADSFTPGLPVTPRAWGHFYAFFCSTRGRHWASAASANR